MSIRKRVRSHALGPRGNIRGWRDALAGAPAFIIGNGPSLADVSLKSLSNRFTIGINRAFLKIDTTILIWQDSELWYQCKHQILKTQSIKLCRNTADVHGRFLHFRLANGGFKLPDEPSTLHGRGSTGPLAFQLAWSLGCDPIVLLGMDCRYEGRNTDFYGRNPSHKPHTLRNCARGLNWIRECGHGRTVVNCSNNEVWTRTSLEEAINEIGDVGCYTREQLSAKLLKRL